ncbi:AraC family transcriptional regulator [soil metagenome]
MEAFKPSPALAPYVTDIWAYEIPASLQTGAAATLTLLPDGFPTMCFVYKDPLQAAHGAQRWSMRSAVCGFQARPMYVSCAGEAAGLTVRFTPWGLPCFVPSPLEEAVDRRVACRDLFPASIIESLESELSELPTSLARVRRVEAFLMTQLRVDGMDPLVRAVVAASSSSRAMSEIAHHVGASERTMERRFRRAVGVPPKMFSRVARLQRALRRHEQRASWAESALDAGYYDQAHLIRDAKELLGVSPDALYAPGRNDIAEGFQSLARETRLASTLFR